MPDEIVLQTQMLALSDRTRVEIALRIDGAPRVEGLAANAYDDPMHALRDACAFVETALSAVRAEANRLRP